MAQPRSHGRSRPRAELPFSEIDADFMIRRLPGVFAAGEMLDWEAPTGGYLLQASFATGAAAGSGALKWLESKPRIDRSRLILGHQCESTSGPAGGGGRGTDDDCTADDCALGFGGACCGIGAACWDGDEGGDDIFCLMSSSTACNVAMFWTICSCLAASCSTLRRTASRLDARGSSCCTGSGEVAAAAADFAVDNIHASVGARAASVSLAASP